MKIDWLNSNTQIIKAGILSKCPKCGEPVWIIFQPFHDLEAYCSKCKWSGPVTGKKKGE